MKPQPPPSLERRRAADFERELLLRARTWIPSWSLDEDDPADFGLALLKIAARFSSEVAERLDVTGNKMALGFLDWLGVPAAAARPARMPVVFKMAETARDPVFAAHPIKMQVDVGDDTVTFETETDLEIIPGQLAAVVAADPVKDAYYLPPPGLCSLEPIEPLPSAWTLKNFAAAKSATLQLDPGLGLAADMLLEIDGNQYRIVKAQGDLVTIDPPVPTGDGFAQGDAVTKVEAFRPFDRARNLQEHILYIGDPGLLNIDAKARIEVEGLEGAPEDLQWEYWGKADSSQADPQWQPLTPEMTQQGTLSQPLVLDKAKGSVETTTIGTVESRWIRATLIMSNGLLSSDSITLKINPSDKPPNALKAADGSTALPPVDIFVNATASTPENVFLFGQEPHLLDTLYIGSDEAFSKAEATAWVQFNLSDGTFRTVATLDAYLLGKVLAAIDNAGALHLFSIGSSGQLAPLAGRGPMQPSASVADGTGIALDPDVRPLMWLEGASLRVAVVAGSDIWVWTETPPFFGQSGWTSFESLPSNSSPAKVESLAIVTDGPGFSIIALDNGQLYKRRTDLSSAWSELNPAIPSNQTLLHISSFRTISALQMPDVFLALTKNASNANGRVHAVKASGAASELLNQCATDVVPFGLWTSSAVTQVVAVQTGLVPQLKVVSSNVPAKTMSFNQPDISNTNLDGSIVGGLLQICTVGTDGDRNVLATWSPFDPEAGDVLFHCDIPGLSGQPTSVSVLVDRLFVPGNGRGEVLTASLGPLGRRSAPGSAFKSAMAFGAPPPPLSKGDAVALTTVSPFPYALVAAAAPADGLGDASGEMLFLLDGFLKGGTARQPVQYFFASGTSSGTGTVGGAQDKFHVTTVPAAGTTHLLVESTHTPSGYDVVEIVAGGLTNDLTVDPALSSPVGPNPLKFWEGTAATGSVVPALELDSTNDDLDSDKLRAGVSFPQLQPSQQATLAVANDASTSKPLWLAFADSWTSGIPSSTPVSFFVDGVSAWGQARPATTTNPTLSWEYWNGSGWWHLPVTDGTDRLRESGMVSFDIPADLQPTEWSGKTSHWIRARLIAGSYGEAQVYVIQEPVPNTSPPQTKQTVVRDTSGLQPPYAISVRAAYAVNKGTIPQFLLTKDSGALRDQSDANRTDGAMLELFMPLSVMLDRLDASPSSSAGSDDCAPDCSCDDGTPSSSPKANSKQSAAAAPGPSTAGRRAIFLGFTSKLQDGPVKILFLAASEGNYDKIAPLRVDALIGGRFIPVIASDDSRGLGETGILTMDFDTAPLQADLFGQSLSWLRIAPSTDSTAWMPSIGGIYLNAVWTRAAETMTRELLGSSTGEPGLTVTLARPPLLDNSLELRVREPLGDEERAALLAANLNSVTSHIPDLPGDWVLWEQVPDPVDCGPKDRVYALDASTGTVQFGDGRHGMIPPAGVDCVVAFGYERTDPIKGGTISANLVKPRTELNLVSALDKVQTILAADQSAGGVGPESPDRVLQFAPAKLRNRGRAVSASDFEDLALENSDEIVQARCFSRNGRIRLVVVVRGLDPAPSRAQQRELINMLLEFGPVSLGAPGALTIEAPRVRRLGVMVELGVKTLDDSGEVGRAAKASLVNRFSTELRDDPSEGWPLGRTPNGDDIAEALLDLPGLESIVSISLFQVDERGAEQSWQGPVASNELVMLMPDNVRVGFDILEAAA